MLALLPSAAALLPFRGFAQVPLFGKRKKQQTPAAPLVYLGGDTINSASKGIYLARFNPATGQLTTPALVAECVRPSYMATAMVGKRRLLYAANEGHDEPSSGVSSYVINPADGSLTFLGKVSAGGAGPCFISVDETASCAFVANYTGSSVASYKINGDGTLTQPVDRVDFKQPSFGHHGPNAARQDASHPHSANVSPDNRFLIVNDLGNDNIATFYIDNATAHLGPAQLNESRTAGSGPRHIAFHPNGRWAYGVNELNSTVQHYLWNTTHSAGGSTPVALLTEAGAAVSTLDAAYRGLNTAAEIAVTADGSAVIVSNRGENSLVVFAIDGLRGALTLRQRVACAGKTPRQFTLDQTGRWLLCGNQDSGTVTVFSVDRNQQISGPVQTLAIPMPQMILFA
jgi:6-phosphogluconolactonase